MNYTCFKSPFGWAGIAKSEQGIARLIFGAPTETAAADRLFDGIETTRSTACNILDSELSKAVDALMRYSREEGRAFQRLSPEVRRIFTAAPWPGNVRQLLNVLRNVVVLNDGDQVLPSMLPPGLGPGPTAGDAGDKAPAGGFHPGALVGRTLAEIERTAIEATIAASGGSVPRAAKMLGVAPSTLYRKMEAWGRH